MEKADDIERGVVANVKVVPPLTVEGTIEEGKGTADDVT
jgi:hypothetical protein